MAEIYIGFDPYTLKVNMKIDSNDIDSNSKFYNHVQNEKICVWMCEYKMGKTVWKGFLPELVDETNDVNFIITFKGKNSDFILFKDILSKQQEILSEEGLNINIEYKQLKFDSYESYREKVSSALNIIEKQYELISRFENLDKFQCKLQDIKNKLEKDCFKVYVVSNFKDGKSSLINALIGEKILPVKIFHKISVLTEIKYGKDYRFLVYSKKDKNAPFEISRDDLEKFINVENLDDCNYDKVEIYIPSKVLENGIVFIDTPSLNNQNIFNTIMNNNMVESDLIIYTMSSIHAFGISDRKLINKINSLNYKKIVFALTFFDLIKEDEDQVDEFVEVMKNNLYKLTDFKERGIQFISSLEALQNKLDCKEHNDNTSLLDIEKLMEEYLIKSVGNKRLKLICSELKKINEETQKIVESSLNNDLNENQEILNSINSLLKSVE